MGSPSSLNTNPSGHIILFDGLCNLCNGAVLFIIRRDPKQKFKFASLQSLYGQAQLNRIQIENSFQSIILITDRQFFVRSDAALEITRHLSGVWPVLHVLKIIPKFIRDTVYDFIAKNRYKFFGKTEFCAIPTPELMQRFVDQGA